MFDDTRGFQALGSAINLHPWYGEALAIRHACFVTGSEELLLVDSRAQARVFSQVTLQFRYVWVCLFYSHMVFVNDGCERLGLPHCSLTKCPIVSAQHLMVLVC